QRDDVRQLRRALDQAVTREDLLEQGRAGPRQSHDEYRVRRGTAHALARPEKLLVEQLYLPRGVEDVLFRVEAVMAPANGVALPVVLERFVVLAPVLQCLAEREREVGLVVR